MTDSGSSAHREAVDMDKDKAPTTRSDHARHTRSAKHPFERFRTLWLQKTGIDARTAQNLFKAMLAPTICLAAFQSTSWSDVYTTLGYLVMISSILASVWAPRAKFLQNLIAHVVAVCLTASVALLAMYSIVQARILSEQSDPSSTPGGSDTSGVAAGGVTTTTYSSSACAVAGVWLFFIIYCIASIRALLPHFTVSCIFASIFANVSMVYAPQLNTMVACESFTKSLLVAMLTGMGVAAGVSLFIFPFNTRQIVFAMTKGYIGSLRDCLAAGMDYFHSMETSDVLTPQRINTAGQEVAGSTEAAAFKAKVAKLSDLHAKLYLELPFAKREIALGKLGPDDVQEMFRRLRTVMVPMSGLSSVSDIFQRIANEADRSDLPTDQINTKPCPQMVEDWHNLMRALREPFGRVGRAIDQGLAHVSIVLQLAPKSARNEDSTSTTEEGVHVPQPGGVDFAAHYSQITLDFLESKKDMLRAWCQLHDIVLPDDFFDQCSQDDFVVPRWMNEVSDSGVERRLRRQMFLCLYMEFLLFNVARRVHDFILFAEGLRTSGKLDKRRIVVPGYKRLRKWARSIVMREPEQRNEDQFDGGPEVVTIALGDAYHRRKDPEHLPPETLWERTTQNLTFLARWLASPASAFGFRVACATISIAIIGYLQPTQVFFTRYRLFWAMIMVSISMSPSAGQSLRAFILRSVGTILFYGVSLAAWYIPDGRTAGVIVFTALFMTVPAYIVLKYPQYVTVGMVGQITLALIVGYELQVRKVGLEVAQSNGQAYQPIYILGLIRVAAVCGGLFVAWIWTIFPYPISEHSQVRQKTGRGLYLLAHYYSVMYETFRYSVQHDLHRSAPRTRQLDKQRLQSFSKCNVLLSGLRAQMGFIGLDLPAGGRFPKQRYEELVALLQSALNYMALGSVASASFLEVQTFTQSGQGLRWLAAFRKVMSEANVTSQKITTLLSLLSASITNGQALPPYLRVPSPYALTEQLEALDRDILSVRHIAEPGYASFAVMQLSTRLLIDDLQRILDGVKALVGELDFSFHWVPSTAVSSQDALKQE